jgi:FMN phosphatase YigB (HAD superfamily)
LKSYIFPITEEQRTEIFRANLITFDLFDTIVFRLNKTRHQRIAYGEFGFLVRKSFEFFCRILQKVGLVRDFKLNWLRPFFGKKIDREFEEDLDRLRPRLEIVALIEELNFKKKTILVVTNSYYSTDQISRICEKFQLSKSIRIIVSSEYGITKSKGLLFFAYGPLPDLHWHFGDNQKEDGCVSEDNFVFVPSIWEKNSIVSSFSKVKSFYGIQYEPLRDVLQQVVQNHSSVEDLLFWFGVCISGPLSVYIAQQVEKYAERFQAEVYYLARDGYLPHEYSKLLENGHVSYLPYSRKISRYSHNLDYILQQIHFTIKNQNNKQQTKIVFDLGWTGITANKLRQKMQSNSHLILGGRWPWARGNVDAINLFWSKHQLIKALKFRSFPELFEMALSAPHASLTAVPDNFDNWENEILRDERGERIVKGAITFHTRWLENGNLEVNQKAAFSTAFKLINDPPDEFVWLVKGFEHDFLDFKVPLVSTQNQPIVFWLKGTLRLQKLEGISIIKRIVTIYRELARRVGSLLGIQGWSRDGTKF